MQVSFRHIGLIVGIIAVLTSFLFFGRQQVTYLIMLLVGLLISSVCFLWILFGRETIKSKLLWIGIVALSFFLNWLTESTFINASYRIYFYQYREELAEANGILKSNPGEIWILNDSISVKNGPALVPIEKQKLLQSKRKLGTYMILKTDSAIYYGLWGFLDVRLGLKYAITEGQPNEQSSHFTGSWFH